MKDFLAKIVKESGKTAISYSLPPVNDAGKPERGKRISDDDQHELFIAAVDENSNNYRSSQRGTKS